MEPGDEIDDSTAPLMEHLVELRKRLLWSAVAMGISFAICMYFVNHIYEFLIQPAIEAGQKKLIYTKLFEGFFTQIKVAFFAASMVSFPIVANQLWKFIAPGLYRREKDALKPFFWLTPILFTMGAALAYYVIMPLALKFLLSFQHDYHGLQQEALPSVADYLSKVMTFMFGFGIAFQLPVVMLILERVGAVTREQFSKGRRYAIFISTTISALVTPPDPLSMILLILPLVILYELALIAMWFTGKRRAKLVEQTQG